MSDEMSWDEIMEMFKGVKISFSKNCCSGLVGDKCQCWRCRKERNEPVTEETELEAARISKEAQADFRKTIKRQYDERHGRV